MIIFTFIFNTKLKKTMLKRFLSSIGLIFLILIGIQCKQEATSKSTGVASSTTNPLLQKWEGNHNGVPAFDLVKIEDFAPAFEIAMTENRNELKAITSDSATANFENTIEAIEKSGYTLKRVRNIYEIWKSNKSTPELDKIQETMEPRLASFNDSIIQNAALFKRIDAVHNTLDKKSKTPEQVILVDKYYKNFVLAGAKLDDKSKTRVAQINQELAGLFSKFSQHQLGDEGSKFVELKDEKDLTGLPKDMIAAQKEKATAKKLPNSWVIANTRSSIEPFLTYSDRRDLREKAWRMFINRGDNGDANDNNKIITQILQLRAERAKLLGYPTHAHWRLADKMAKTPENAMQLLESVWTPAVARVHEEVADMQALADKEGAKIKIEPWDYRYYAEKVRKAKFDLNQDEVKEYLQLEKLREGLFFVAGELFDLKFTQVKDVPVFHPDVRVWQVDNKTSGKQIGLWYFDPYAREGKRSGAWMTAYRDQEKLSGNITTIVSNNCNFIKGKEGEPVLISWDDARTLFHEFGHALHGLNSNVTYPLLSGTNVATDYVEFPSQIMERWFSTPEVLNQFALNYKTGKPIPQTLVDKLKKAETFNKGFVTTELLASALVDMKLHLAGSKVIDPDAFEKETLTALQMPSELVMRHRTPQFGHIFADDGYSAGYYSYLWSDVISADAYEAFTEAGGPYDKKVAKRLYDNVFSIGGTIDEAVAYRNFRGKAISTDALMRSRGFKVIGKK
jgi:peptidyl-dipeptidase Dcp